MLPQRVEAFATVLLRSSRKVPAWIVVLGSLFGLCGVVWAALQSPVVRTRIRTELQAAIRRELGLDASMASVSISLPFAVVGEQIHLVHPQHGLLASAARLEVAPSLFALLRGEFRLKRVLIDRAHVRLRVEDGHIVNLPRLSAAEPDRAEAQRLRLREFLVRDATLEVDAAPGYTARLERVQIALGVTGDTLLDLSVRAGGGSLTREGVREAVQVPRTLRRTVRPRRSFPGGPAPPSWWT